MGCAIYIGIHIHLHFLGLEGRTRGCMSSYTRHLALKSAYRMLVYHLVLAL
jgi:hypothetical protein